MAKRLPKTTTPGPAPGVAPVPTKAPATKPKAPQAPGKPKAPATKTPAKHTPARPATTPAPAKAPAKPKAPSQPKTPERKPKAQAPRVETSASLTVAVRCHCRDGDWTSAPRLVRDVRGPIGQRTGVARLKGKDRAVHEIHGKPGAFEADMLDRDRPGRSTATAAERNAQASERLAKSAERQAAKVATRKAQAPPAPAKGRKATQAQAQAQAQPAAAEPAPSKAPAFVATAPETIAPGDRVRVPERELPKSNGLKLPAFSGIVVSCKRDAKGFWFEVRHGSQVDAARAVALVRKGPGFIPGPTLAARIRPKRKRAA